jgi:hypothetical protein
MKDTIKPDYVKPPYYLIIPDWTLFQITERTEVTIYDFDGNKMRLIIDPTKIKYLPKEWEAKPLDTYREI